MEASEQTRFDELYAQHLRALKLQGKGRGQVHVRNGKGHKDRFVPANLRSSTCRSICIAASFAREISWAAKSKKPDYRQLPICGVLVARFTTRLAPRTAARARIRLLARQSQAAPQASAAGVAGDTERPNTASQTSDVLPAVPATDANRVDDCTEPTGRIKKISRSMRSAAPANQNMLATQLRLRSAAPKTEQSTSLNGLPSMALKLVVRKHCATTVHDHARPAFAETGKASAQSCANNPSAKWFTLI
jgi:hypothetical protein